jgi:hypothetical protein
VLSSLPQPLLIGLLRILHCIDQLTLFTQADEEKKNPDFSLAREEPGVSPQRKPSPLRSRQPGDQTTNCNAEHNTASPSRRQNLADRVQQFVQILKIEHFHVTSLLSVNVGWS